MTTMLHTKTLCVGEDLSSCPLSDHVTIFVRLHGSFSGEVNMNVNVNCKLAMGTAAATVGHRAYIDQICVPQSMSTKTDEKLF